MGIEDTVAIIDALTKFIGTLAWPAIFVFSLLKYGQSIKNFSETLSEVTLKAAGFEASFVKRQKDEASKALAAAVVNQQKDAPTAILVQEVLAANNAVSGITVRNINKLSGASALWVDDIPDNNKNERRSLEALGVSFILSTSTDEALALLSKEKFDVIISDMGRPPDSKAGYTLLDKLRSSGDRTPYIIYAGSSKPEQIEEAKKRGAIGCTNRPDQLFEYVLRALLG